MEPFDSLEKLITEHGSAQILRERLGLIQDQYSALQRENERLRADNLNLREDNLKLIAAGDQLKKSQPAVNERLETDVERVLLELTNANCFVPAGRIQQALGISEVKAEYCIGVLIEHDYVKTSGINFDDVETTYCVTHTGRKYAFKNGLVK